MNSKVANKPILTNKGLDARKVSAGEGFALYWIDAGANHSKFYEGLMLENDDGTWSVTFRWGALTDSGFTGRIDGAKWDGKFAHLGKSQAQAALQKKYRAKTGKGYMKGKTGDYHDALFVKRNEWTCSSTKTSAASR